MLTFPMPKASQIYNTNARTIYPTPKGSHIGLRVYPGNDSPVIIPNAYPAKNNNQSLKIKCLSILHCIRYLQYAYFDNSCYYH
jgi:hypothetical protein